MVTVSEFCGRQVFKFDVVLDVGRRHDHGTWLRKLEDDTLEGRQPGDIHVLDHFDEGGGIETGKAFVAVRERCLKKIQPGSLPWRQLVEPEAALRNSQRAR